MRAFLLVAVLALAACGASGGRVTKGEYAKRAQEIERRDESAAGVFVDVTGHDLPKPLCVRDMKQLGDAVQKIVDDARGLRPPLNLQRYHDAFVSNAQESVDAVRAATKRVERGELRCGDEMNRTIYGMPSTDRAEHALQQLADHGVALCITTCE